MLLEPQDGLFSVRRQGALLGLNRSSLYYGPVGESQENLGLMRLLDEQVTPPPCYGMLKMEAIYQN